MVIENVQQLQDDIQQAMHESLQNSNFGKVLQKYGILEGKLVKVQCMLDLTKIQLSNTVENQQFMANLRQELFLEVAKMDCCWCPPNGTCG